LGFPHSPAFAESRFRSLRGSSLTPSPNSLRNRVKPPATAACYGRSPPPVPPTTSFPATVELTADVLPLQRPHFPAWIPARIAPRWNPPSLGFCALIATQAHSVVLTADLRQHVRQGSQPCRLSVLGVSHALDGFLRRVPCRFISPRSRFQGSPKGFVPSTQPRHLVDGRLPSRRLTSPRYSQLPSCATLRRPVLRAFIRAEICLSLVASVTPRRCAVPLGSSSSRCSRLARPCRL